MNYNLINYKIGCIQFNLKSSFYTDFGDILGVKII